METPGRQEISTLTWVTTQGSICKIMDQFHLTLTYKGKGRRYWYQLCGERREAGTLGSDGAC